MDSIVIGVGNPLLGDDSIGIAVAEMLKGKINANVEKSMGGGIEICEMIVGYDLAIVIDAYKGDEAGNVKEIPIDEYEGMANHDINFPSAYKLLKNYFKMPEVRIIGIEVNNIVLGEKISEDVRKAIPVVLDKIKEILEDKNAIRKN